MIVPGWGKTSQDLNPPKRVSAASSSDYQPCCRQPQLLRQVAVGGGESANAAQFVRLCKSISRPSLAKKVCDWVLLGKIRIAFEVTASCSRLLYSTKTKLACEPVGRSDPSSYGHRHQRNCNKWLLLLFAKAAAAAPAKKIRASATIFSTVIIVD